MTETSTAPPSSNADLQSRRDAVFGTGAALFYSDPVHIVRGEGVYLFDQQGRRYVDMYNNVPCVGHANPHVVQAMQQQASTLNVHSRYLHEGVLQYAERLVARHWEGIESVVFTCTGSEANEVALAIARAATGGRGIICTDSAYHGNTAEVSKLTYAGFRDPDPEVRSIPFPQEYRPLAACHSSTELCDLYLARLRAEIDGFAKQGIQFAGMLVCPILANEGLPDIPEGFMRRAATLVRETGGLFIVDEVQAGMCRTGEWWGYERMDVQPDIVSMGKPMGNGMPLAAALASRKLVDTFRARTRYFNTFASSPLQAAAGGAVLDEIESRGLREQVADVGAYLKAELQQRMSKVDRIDDVRGHGLFVGVEWVREPTSKEPDAEEAAAVAEDLKERGFLASNAGALRNVLKLRPPLVFEREHADAFLAAFDDVLHERYGVS